MTLAGWLRRGLAELYEKFRRPRSDIAAITIREDGHVVVTGKVVANRPRPTKYEL